MKIYTLVENSKKAGSPFMNEHGLSLYFECNGKRILLDTGASGAFIYNATLHGIDLGKVDICVISHAHWDHTGGLAHFLDINDRARVYMKTAAKGDIYTRRMFRYERSGIDPAFFEKYGGRITFIDGDTPITPDVTAAAIKTYRHPPQFTSLMYTKSDDSFVRDDLSHELFLAVNTRDGVIVLTGCAHHGIINIAKTAQEKFGSIYAVIGGFHLNGSRRFGLRFKKESMHEVRTVARFFHKNGIGKIYTGHCTGEKPLEKLQMHSRTKKMFSGDIITL